MTAPAVRPMRMDKQMPIKNRRVLRLPQAMEKSGLGRDSIYRLGNMGRFPKPIKLGQRASGWFEDEIDAWLDQRAAERDNLLGERDGSTEGERGIGYQPTTPPETSMATTNVKTPTSIGPFAPARRHNDGSRRKRSG